MQHEKKSLNQNYIDNIIEVLRFSCWANLPQIGIYGFSTLV